VDSKAKRSVVRFSHSQVLAKNRGDGTNQEAVHTKNCPCFLVEFQIQNDGNIFTFIKGCIYNVQKALSKLRDFDFLIPFLQNIRINPHMLCLPLCLFSYA